ncbi:zinc ribbon domain-containing protein [uncultured Phascolarctobacterium sp.]|uniref:zinc ribbon domain-containing protein n=1 Tax=uncultured Phascolarctobacterium sp. TaxID=512296 RepID=UPI0025DDBA6B|nr:zinc ribbon domain-containing protein [uncultured Phascolarctobacterium sp.]
MDNKERIIMQCKYCGQPISDNCNYCSNCGRAVREEAAEVKRESKFWEQGWFAVLMLFIFWPVGLYLLWRYHGIFAKAIVSVFLLMLLGVFITVLDINLDRGKSGDSFSKIANSVIAESIPSQEKFNELLARYNQNESKSMTELEKAEFNKSYEKEFNAFFQNGYVKKWCGKVDSVKSEKSGMAASVKLRCDFPKAEYTFETKNYAVDETLIPADSELYKKIRSLKTGDVVIFSGKLVSGDYSKKIVDLTTSYGYRNNKLYIDFTDIEKIDTKE